MLSSVKRASFHAPAPLAQDGTPSWESPEPPEHLPGDTVPLQDAGPVKLSRRMSDKNLEKLLGNRRRTSVNPEKLKELRRRRPSAFESNESGPSSRRGSDASSAGMKVSMRRDSSNHRRRPSGFQSVDSMLSASNSPGSSRLSVTGGSEVESRLGSLQGGSDAFRRVSLGAPSKRNSMSTDSRRQSLASEIGGGASSRRGSVVVRRRSGATPGSSGGSRFSQIRRGSCRLIDRGIKGLEDLPAELRQQLQLLRLPPHKRTNEALKRLVASLSHVKLFERLEDSVKLQVCRHLKFTRCDADSIVFREGETGDKFYIILSGSVGLYVKEMTADEVEVEQDKMERTKKLNESLDQRRRTTQGTGQSNNASRRSSCFMGGVRIAEDEDDDDWEDIKARKKRVAEQRTQAVGLKGEFGASCSSTWLEKAIGLAPGLPPLLAKPTETQPLACRLGEESAEARSRSPRNDRGARCRVILETSEVGLFAEQSEKDLQQYLDANKIRQYESLQDNTWLREHPGAPPFLPPRDGRAVNDIRLARGQFQVDVIPDSESSSESGKEVVPKKKSIVEQRRSGLRLSTIGGGPRASLSQLRQEAEAAAGSEEGEEQEEGQKEEEDEEEAPLDKGARRVSWSDHSGSEFSRDVSGGSSTRVSLKHSFSGASGDDAERRSSRPALKRSVTADFAGFSPGDKGNSTTRRSSGQQARFSALKPESLEDAPPGGFSRSVSDDAPVSGRRSSGGMQARFSALKATSIEDGFALPRSKSGDSLGSGSGRRSSGGGQQARLSTLTSSSMEETLPNRPGSSDSIVSGPSDSGAPRRSSGQSRASALTVSPAPPSTEEVVGPPSPRTSGDDFVGSNKRESTGPRRDSGAAFAAAARRKTLAAAEKEKERPPVPGHRDSLLDSSVPRRSAPVAARVSALREERPGKRDSRKVQRQSTTPRRRSSGGGRLEAPAAGRRQSSAGEDAFSPTASGGPVTPRGGESQDRRGSSTSPASPMTSPSNKRASIDDRPSFTHTLSSERRRGALKETPFSARPGQAEQEVQDDSTREDSETVADGKQGGDEPTGEQKKRRTGPTLTEATLQVLLAEDAPQKDDASEEFSGSEDEEEESESASLGSSEEWSEDEEEEEEEESESSEAWSGGLSDLSEGDLDLEEEESEEESSAGSDSEDIETGLDAEQVEAAMKLLREQSGYASKEKGPKDAASRTKSFFLPTQEKEDEAQSGTQARRMTQHHRKSVVAANLADGRRMTGLGGNQQPKPLFNKGEKVNEIAVLTKGAAFGELALQCDQPRSATVRTKEATIFATLSRADYKAILQSSMDKQQREKFDFLSGVKILDGFQNSAINKIALMMVMRTMSRSEKVYAFGDSVLQIYLVRAGNFAVQWPYDKDEEIRLEEDADDTVDYRSRNTMQEAVAANKRKKVIVSSVLTEGAVFGLSTYILGERSYYNQVSCQSVNGCVYSILAKEFVSHFPRELRERFRQAAHAENAFLENRLMVLRELEQTGMAKQKAPSLRPQVSALDKIRSARLPLSDLPERPRPDVYVVADRLRLIDSVFRERAVAAQALASAEERAALLNQEPQAVKPVQTEDGSNTAAATGTAAPSTEVSEVCKNEASKIQPCWKVEADIRAEYSAKDAKESHDERGNLETGKPARRTRLAAAMHDDDFAEDASRDERLLHAYKLDTFHTIAPSCRPRRRPGTAPAQMQEMQAGTKHQQPPKLAIPTSEAAPGSTTTSELMITLSGKPHTTGADLMGRERLRILRGVDNMLRTPTSAAASASTPKAGASRGQPVTIAGQRRAAELARQERQRERLELAPLSPTDKAGCGFSSAASSSASLGTDMRPADAADRHGSTAIRASRRPSMMNASRRTSRAAVGGGGGHDDQSLEGSTGAGGLFQPPASRRISGEGFDAEEGGAAARRSSRRLSRASASGSQDDLSRQASGQSAGFYTARVRRKLSALLIFARQRKATLFGDALRNGAERLAAQENMPNGQAADSDSSSSSESSSSGSSSPCSKSDKTGADDEAEVHEQEEVPEPEQPSENIISDVFSPEVLRHSPKEVQPEPELGLRRMPLLSEMEWPPKLSKQAPPGGRAQTSWQQRTVPAKLLPVRASTSWQRSKRRLGMEDSSPLSPLAMSDNPHTESWASLLTTCTALTKASSTIAEDMATDRPTTAGCFSNVAESQISGSNLGWSNMSMMHSPSEGVFSIATEGMMFRSQSFASELSLPATPSRQLSKISAVVDEELCHMPAMRLDLDGPHGAASGSVAEYDPLSLSKPGTPMTPASLPPISTMMDKKAAMATSAIYSMRPEPGASRGAPLSARSQGPLVRRKRPCIGMPPLASSGSNPASKPGRGPSMMGTPAKQFTMPLTAR
eukprot:TRINITY_DN40803_c0_g1_i2.p1 TRINITY_DN40803_c0_g1~~TRINITY_DN40803_c0_g1_i2.p1  ORF type:complete len:2366 (+),score=488.22 TRINITY_DN40803_c0_g1_i2:238-7335(+)